MALGKVQKSSLVQNIIAQIEEAILDGIYKTGDRLPPLLELQTIIGASQGTVREAISILQQKGLVEVRRGVKGGAFVKDSNTDSIAEGLGVLIRQRKISFNDLAQFRMVVESGLIRLVVEKVTDKDMDCLKGHLLQLRAVTRKGLKEWNAYLDEEVLLRKDLIAIADNKIYSAVLIPIHENLFAFARNFSNLKEAEPEKAYEDWRKIVKAIEERDANTAVKITTDHIERYAKIYLANYPNGIK
ncbi:MAG: GntR family transcriptional regulator [Proteobacteria bacterium]|nr:GntR family transcriptional regulator [Pseudomonadota bacterium]MBU1713738.1 GntR family transcriptional regulator [Pseudomonadota bacterium]